MIGNLRENIAMFYDEGALESVIHVIVDTCSPGAVEMLREQIKSSLAKDTPLREAFIDSVESVLESHQVVLTDEEFVAYFGFDRYDA